MRRLAPARSYLTFGTYPNRAIRGSDQLFRARSSGVRNGDVNSPESRSKASTRFPPYRSRIRPPVLRSACVPIIEDKSRLQPLAPASISLSAARSIGPTYSLTRLEEKRVPTNTAGTPSRNARRRTRFSSLEGSCPWSRRSSRSLPGSGTLRRRPSRPSCTGPRTSGGWRTKASRRNRGPSH